MARKTKPAGRATRAPKARPLARRLADALAQQAATSEILRVISSQTDVQPVFDAIARSSVRLCEAGFSVVATFDGDMLHLVASDQVDTAGRRALGAAYPYRPNRGQMAGRAILDRGVAHVADVTLDPEYVGAPGLGNRAMLSVPVLRKGTPIGAITIGRFEPRPFTDEQIELLKTFADQAVIAIENARLLSELQDRNTALTAAYADVSEALERQTATAAILGVISNSPTDVQRVLDAVVDSAVRLCDAYDARIWRPDGDRLVRAAGTGPLLAESVDWVPMDPVIPAPAAFIERRTVHFDETQWQTDPRVAHSRTHLGIRSGLATPLMREGQPIGVLGVRSQHPGRFSDKHVDLLRAFADQAVIAIENARLFTELQTSNRDLTTALDTQTATADILRVISRSQTDVQPVFDAILGSAVRLLRACSGTLTRLVGDQVELVALTSTDPADDAVLRTAYPRSLHSEEPHAQTVRARVPLNVADADTDPRLPEATRAYARARGWRSAVLVPMLRHHEAVGAIGVTRREGGGFTDDEIALLQTFADQAVIAIENARLLTELQDKNDALSEALEQQTATGEILKVIASSPTDTQPVFEAIAANAAGLCSSEDVFIVLVEGGVLRAVTGTGRLTGLIPEYNARRVPVSRTSVAGRVIVDRATLHIEDLAAVSEDEFPDGRALQRMFRHRSMLATPLLREGVALGAIVVFRLAVRPFSARQVELLKTFADQAVIAIENVRLFTELQTSNHDLTAALDTQTATSDILRVISRSQTDVQPVFDAIVSSAVRLLGAHTGALTRIAGDRIEIAALTSTDEASDLALRSRFPQSLHSEDPHAQAIRARVPFNVSDAQTDPRWPEAARAYARVPGYRSAVVVPMLRHHEVIGSIGVNRREPGGFTDDEISLLQTFADQAVIAIENARLLTELQARTDELTRSVGELRALGEIGQAIGSTLDLETVLGAIVARASQLAGADAGAIYEYDARREIFEPRAHESLEAEIVQELVTTPIRRGQGVTGRVADTLTPLQLPDIRVGEQILVRDFLIRAGYRALLAVPLAREGHLLGALTVFRKTPGEYAANVVELLQTFATQSALAIQNARLFREIEQKSRELEVASQHKSEFLASMSHELRTPLNAIIGFSDVLLEGMFGETNEKQTEYLRDIHSSGQHLLSLINDILDLSKIEAGRMELDVTTFDLPVAIDDAILLMRERAGRRGITLDRELDGRLGEIRADQRKVKQVLLNLLSNAVKFTPEGGRIAVRAGLGNGAAEISVTDTGIGIAPEDQDAVFEEFRQVGKADRKAEGTGLGLALCRKFVELHGGQIWVKSQVDAGSTFTFTIPLT